MKKKSEIRRAHKKLWKVGIFLAISIGIFVGFEFKSFSAGFAVCYIITLLVDIREDLNA